jgi:hypothetical protein
MTYASARADAHNQNQEQSGTEAGLNPTGRDAGRYSGQAGTLASRESARFVG